MATRTNTEIADIVWNMIDGISDGVSGILPTIVDQQRFFAEQFTGDTIGENIAEMYQPAIISLTAGNVLGLLTSQGLGTKSVKIGELSISKGMNEQSASMFTTDGINKLKALGTRMSFYKAWNVG